MWPPWACSPGRGVSWPTHAGLLLMACPGSSRAAECCRIVHVWLDPVSFPVLSKRSGDTLPGLRTSPLLRRAAQAASPPRGPPLGRPRARTKPGLCAIRPPGRSHVPPWACPGHFIQAGAGPAGLLRRPWGVPESGPSLGCEASGLQPLPGGRHVPPWTCSAGRGRAGEGPRASSAGGLGASQTWDQAWAVSRPAPRELACTPLGAASGQGQGLAHTCRPPCAPPHCCWWANACQPQARRGVGPDPAAVPAGLVGAQKLAPSMARSYQPERTRSRPITEVKLVWAGLVLC